MMGSPSPRNQPTKTSGSRCGASSLKFRACSFPGRTPPVERAVSLSNCCFRSGRRRRFRFSGIRFGADDGGAGAAGLMDIYSALRASTKSRSTEGYWDRAWPWDCIESTSSRSRQCEREETHKDDLGARIRQRRRAALIGEFQLRGGHRQRAALKISRFGV